VTYGECLNKNTAEEGSLGGRGGHVLRSDQLTYAQVMLAVVFDNGTHIAWEKNVQTVSYDQEGSYIISNLAAKHKRDRQMKIL